MSYQPEISIVVPAYREGPQLAENLRQIVYAARSACNSLELIVVDDGSPDQTWDALIVLADELPELHAIRLSRNFGKEAALVAGIAQSRGSAVIVMDADLQHPPELIGEMLRLWREDGYQIVNAVKRARGSEARSKTLLAGLYYRLFSGLAGIDLASASDFKLLDRSAAESLSALPERHTFFRGLIAWMGFRQISIPFDVKPRTSGRSKWSFWKLTALAIDSILSFSAMPMHLITFLGVILAAVSSVFGIRTLWLWESLAHTSPRFTTKLSGGLAISFTRRWLDHFIGSRQTVQVERTDRFRSRADRLNFLKQVNAERRQIFIAATKHHKYGRRRHQSLQGLPDIGLRSEPERSTVIAHRRWPTGHEVEFRVHGKRHQHFTRPGRGLDASDQQGKVIAILRLNSQ
jgi:glycosyltransferase involved in cell wall biosynthesis